MLNTYVPMTYPYVRAVDWRRHRGIRPCAHVATVFGHRTVILSYREVNDDDDVAFKTR